MFQRRNRRSWFELTREFFWPRSGWRRALIYLRYRLMRLRASPYAIAIGFGLGVTTSFTPLVGFHFLLAAALCFPLRGSVLAAALGTLIGNPLTFPFMWGSSYHLGLLMLGHGGSEHAHVFAALLGDVGKLDFSMLLQNLGSVTLPWMVGSLVIGPAAGSVAFVLVRSAVEAYRRHRQHSLLLSARAHDNMAMSEPEQPAQTAAEEREAS